MRDPKANTMLPAQAWGEVMETTRAHLRATPARTLGVAAVVGFVVGGGLATRMMARVLGSAVRIIATPLIVAQISAAAERMMSAPLALPPERRHRKTA
jgi:uncharacterized protein (DUF1786 family)